MHRVCHVFVGVSAAVTCSGAAGPRVPGGGATRSKKDVAATATTEQQQQS